MFSNELINQINFKCDFYEGCVENDQRLFNYVLDDSKEIFNDYLIKKNITNIDESFKRILLKVLEVISFRTNLKGQLSLNKSMFDAVDILRDSLDVLHHFYNLQTSNELDECFNAVGLSGMFSDCKDSDYIKNCLKVNSSKSVHKLLPDIFMMMFLVDNLDYFDFENSYIIDNGYRAKVFTYTKDEWHYPIEVHFWDIADFEFNYWYVKNQHLMEKDSMGARLRVMYNSMMIRSEQDFRDVIENLNFSSSF